MKNKNPHGVTIRCSKYPLKVDDTLTICSGQVSGILDNGYPHDVSPGDYFISKSFDYTVTLQRVGSDAFYTDVACSSLRAILGHWSNYQTASIMICPSELLRYDFAINQRIDKDNFIVRFDGEHSNARPAGCSLWAVFEIVGDMLLLTDTAMTARKLKEYIVIED